MKTQTAQTTQEKISDLMLQCRSLQRSSIMEHAKELGIGDEQQLIALLQTNATMEVMRTIPAPIIEGKASSNGTKSPKLKTYPKPVTVRHGRGKPYPDAFKKGVIEFCRDHPEVSKSQIAARFNISDTSASRFKKQV